MPIVFDQSDALCLIRLEGEVDIAGAAEVKKLLLQALASEKEVRVELERTTGVDVTALQLLYAAEREAERSGVTVTVVGHVPEAISVAVRDAGFERFPIPIAEK